MNQIGEVCNGMFGCGAPPMWWTISAVVLLAFMVYMVGALLSAWTFFGKPVSIRP